MTGTLRRLQPDDRRPAPPPPSASRATPDRRHPPTISGTPKIGGRADRRPRHLGARHGLHLPVARQRRRHHRRHRPDRTPRRSPPRSGQTLDVVVTGTKAGYTTLTQDQRRHRPRSPPATRSSRRPRRVSPAPPKVGVAVRARPRRVGRRRRRSPSSGRPTAPTSPAPPPAPFTPTAAQLGQTLTVDGDRHQARHHRRSCATSAASAAGRRRHADPAADPDDHRHPARRHGRRTGVPGTWDTGTTRTYQWYADGVADHRRDGHDLHADGRPDRPGADLRGHQHPRRLHHRRQDQRRPRRSSAWPRR